MSNSESSGIVVCHRCGEGFGKRAGNFLVSYGEQHKGAKSLPICRKCTDVLFKEYLSYSGDVRKTIRQMCRKLDLYWNERAFEASQKKSSNRSMFTGYLQRINALNYAGKSYDDTLIEEGALWKFPGEEDEDEETVAVDDGVTSTKKRITNRVVEFWGSGYTADMYEDLEKRRKYYTSRFPEVEMDLGTEVLIRQICILEVGIARDSVAGKSVDKSVNSLNTILGSLNLRPVQRREEDTRDTDVAPLGVWIHRFENERPIPDVDPELADVDGVVKYITTWFLGHLKRMLGLKGNYVKLYEDEIERLRLERPEYDEEDDVEDVFDGIFGNSGGEEDEDQDEKDIPAGE